MSIREVRKKSGIQIMQCIVCNLSQAKIGNTREWSPAIGGHVCGKEACRIAAGMPKYVPPDERE